MAELVATAAAPAPAAAKKSKKTSALTEAPRFGRVKTNLKVRFFFLLLGLRFLFELLVFQNKTRWES